MGSYKGVEDFLPKDKKTLNHIISIWKEKTVNRGFLEYETSVLEELDTFLKHTSEEILQGQIYKFSDNKGRIVALKPEMTPVLSRLITDMGTNFRAPYRLFSIANIFRYEKPQKGRQREHRQLNVDILGSQDLTSEAEILLLIKDILDVLKIDFVIKINDREFISNFYQNVQNKKDLFTLLDKKEKMDSKEFDNELKKILKEKVKIPSDKDIPDSIKKLQKIIPGIKLEYAPTMVRGFNYYTGIVFEVYSKDEENLRSICGGGRYDNLLMSTQGENVHSVGFGMGDVVLRDIIKKDKIENKITYHPVISEDINKSFEVVKKIKNTFVYPINKTIGNTLKRIETQYMNIGNVEAIIIEDKDITLKDLKTFKIKKFKNIQELKKHYENSNI